jgi:hypothetical protein
VQGGCTSKSTPPAGPQPLKPPNTGAGWLWLFTSACLGRRRRRRRPAAAPATARGEAAAGRGSPGRGGAPGGKNGRCESPGVSRRLRNLDFVTLFMRDSSPPPSTRRSRARWLTYGVDRDGRTSHSRRRGPSPTTTVTSPHTRRRGPRLAPTGTIWTGSAVGILLTATPRRGSGGAIAGTWLVANPRRGGRGAMRGLCWPRPPAVAAVAQLRGLCWSRPPAPGGAGVGVAADPRPRAGRHGASPRMATRCWTGRTQATSVVAGTWRVWAVARCSLAPPPPIFPPHPNPRPAVALRCTTCRLNARARHPHPTSHSTTHVLQPHRIRLGGEPWEPSRVASAPS